jgi:hypothetical protein
VAEHAAQGQSNKQIADEMGLSEHTVKNYLFRIFEKLGMSSRFELLFLLFNERNNPAISRAAKICTRPSRSPVCHRPSNGTCEPYCATDTSPPFPGISERLDCSFPKSFDP